jgi:chromosome segregation protein
VVATPAKKTTKTAKQGRAPEPTENLPAEVQEALAAAGRPVRPPTKVPAAPPELVAWVEAELQRVRAAQAELEARVGDRILADGDLAVPDGVGALLERARELHGPHLASVGRVAEAEAAAKEADTAAADAGARHAELSRIRDAALSDLHLYSRQRADHLMGAHQSQLAALDAAALPKSALPVLAYMETIAEVERALFSADADESGATKRKLFGRKGDGRGEYVAKRDNAAREARKLIAGLGADAPLLELAAPGCPECASLKQNLEAAEVALGQADGERAGIAVEAFVQQAEAAQRTLLTARTDEALRDAEWREIAPVVARAWLEARAQADAPMAHTDDAAWREARGEALRLQGYAEALVLDLRGTQAEAAKAELARLEATVTECRAAAGEVEAQLAAAQTQLEAGGATITTLLEDIATRSAAIQTEARATADALSKEAEAEADLYRDRLADARRDAEGAMLTMAAQRDEARRDGDAVAANVRAESEALHTVQRERLAAIMTELREAETAARESIQGVSEAFATERQEADAQFRATVDELAELQAHLLTAGETAAATLRADLERFTADSRERLQAAERDATDALERINAQREAAAGAMAAHSTAASEAHAERLGALAALVEQSANSVSERVKVAKAEIEAVGSATDAALQAVDAKRRELLDGRAAPGGDGAIDPITLGDG